MKDKTNEELKAEAIAKKPKTCKHKNWFVKSYVNISGGMKAQERECSDCNLIIIV